MSGPPDIKRKSILASAMFWAMDTRACILGVSMSIHDRGDGTLTFSVSRDHDSRPGRGAFAIGEFLEMADAAGIEVVIDVRRTDERLFSYYHDFGFRLVDGDVMRERAEIEEIIAENAAWKASGRSVDDLGVITMHREPWAGPLATEEEVLSITGNLAPPRTRQEESARQRDALLALLQTRGVTAGGAGARVSPNLCAHEVAVRMTQRRKEGWNIPLFARHTAKAA